MMKGGRGGEREGGQWYASQPEGERWEGGRKRGRGDVELSLCSRAFLREAIGVCTGKWVNSEAPLPLSPSHHLLSDLP